MVQLSEVLRDDFQKYSSLSASLNSKPLGYSFLTEWRRPYLPQRSGTLHRMPGLLTAGGADALCRGAIRLLDEVIRRVPVHAASDEELENWLLVYARLTASIRKMGILFLLPQSSYEIHLTSMFDALQKYVTGRKLFDWIDYYPPLYGGQIPSCIRGLEWTDAIDDLHQWPVPRGLEKTLSSLGNSKNPTLLNFLAAFLANPPTTENSPPQFLPKIDFALFAAARIVAPAVSSWEDHAIDSVGGASPDFQHRMLTRLASFAWNWLVDQLPRRGFGPLLEQAIEQTSGLIFA